MHHVAAVRDAAKVAQLSANRERVARKARIDRSAARADVLTQSTLARTRHNRRAADSIAHCLAQATTSNFHDGSLCRSDRYRRGRLRLGRDAARDGARKYASDSFIIHCSSAIDLRGPRERATCAYV